MPVNSSVRRLAALVLGAAALAAAGPLPSAWAHGESTPLVHAVVDEVSPPLPPGVVVRTKGAGNTLLEIENRTAEDLELLAPGGEPFLRIGRAGVLANVNSVYWFASGNPDAIARVPPGTRRGGAPRWVRASQTPKWSWYEHRLHPQEVMIPPEALETQVSRRLFDFTVPTRLGGRPTELAGYVEYRPVLGGLVPKLTSSPPRDSGVAATLVPGDVPAIFLTNSSDEPVTVLGRAGEPFARIGPRGAYVNLRSVTYRDDRRARGGAPEAKTDPTAPPRWRKLEDESSLLWLESRARYAAQPPMDVQRGEEPTRLMEWGVPLRQGARRLDVRGETSWVPAPPPSAGRGSDSGLGDTTSIVLVGLLAVLAIGGSAYGATRLRRRGSRQLTAR